MRKRITFLSLIVVCLFVAGCDLVPELPFSESGPETCDAPGLLLEDDFSGERDCGWVQYNRGGAVVDVSDGALQISTSNPGEIWWTNPGKQFDNVVVSVEATQVSGPDDNAFGIICRYQDEENFYLFLISSDGYYAIGRYAGQGQVDYLTEGAEFIPSDAINQGQAANQIRASCIGNELSMTVNGIALLTVTDSTFAAGDVGLGVSTLQPGTAVVSFDNIRVTAP